MGRRGHSLARRFHRCGRRRGRRSYRTGRSRGVAVSAYSALCFGEDGGDVFIGLGEDGQGGAGGNGLTFGDEDLPQHTGAHGFDFHVGLVGFYLYHGIT